jgi:hypothetical protein
MTRNGDQLSVARSSMLVDLLGLRLVFEPAEVVHSPSRALLREDVQLGRSFMFAIPFGACDLEFALELNDYSSILKGYPVIFD